MLSFFSTYNFTKPTNKSSSFFKKTIFFQNKKKQQAAVTKTDLEVELEKVNNELNEVKQVNQSQQENIENLIKEKESLKELIDLERHSREKSFVVFKQTHEDEMDSFRTEFDGIRVF